MKKALVLVFALSLFSFQFLQAQILHPVKWEWKSEQIAKGEYKLIFTASIEKGWHVYSQKEYPADILSAPTPTAFIFEKNTDVQLIGKPSETGPKIHDGFDEIFELNVKSFEEKLVCEQKVKVSKDTRLKGTISWGVCNDRTCLPPDEVEFSFDLSGSGKSGIKIQWDSTSRGENTPVINNSVKPAFDSAVQAAIDQSIIKDSTTQAGIMPTDGADKYGQPVSTCGEEKQTITLWLAILLGFGGGLIALVTPCVFPMIPLTVSFFIKRSESKSKGKFEALIYSFSIVLIYFLISVPFLIFNVSSDTLNEISTGAALNIFFFIIFVFFAFSFFGYYEITLPSFIANKADSASNVGGIAGIFFMAVTLAIVSFSCTGPILGSLLVSASTGGKLYLVAGMTSFGLALALPFGLFAFFPNLMKSLPKSGGWLNSVKVVLGFAELIFALKFLSNADLVSHWGILKREIFLGLWALLGLGTFLYLIGVLRFPHDSPSKLSPVRAAVATVALAFTLYTGYGIAGNDLNLFSGFPPPKFYSIFETKSAIEPIKNDYAAALAKAKAENKLVMIDFTGWACVNCRKMEENVWPDIEVMKRLNEKYVIVSLYVDDKKVLPESEQYISPVLQGKKVKTLGNKYSEMQAKYFGANTQPYYVLISPEEKLLTSPRGYTPSAQEYAMFLDCGYNASKQLSSR